MSNTLDQLVSALQTARYKVKTLRRHYKILTAEQRQELQGWEALERQYKHQLAALDPSKLDPR